MAECSKCGISGSSVRLFDAISGNGIIKICDKCFSDENIPIVKKPTTFQLKEAERKRTVYERLSKISGIKDNKGIWEQNRELLKKQETTLKDIIDKNYKIKFQEKPKVQGELVEYFHWVIMRARRKKHLTTKQLAEAIQESEAAIKMAEQGIIPEGSGRLINKLENYLEIKILEKENPKFKHDEIEKGPILFEKEKPKEIAFDKEGAKNLTIADLKEMKRQKEKNIFEDFKKEPETEIVNDKEEKELSDEEIDDIFLGRK